MTKRDSEEWAPENIVPFQQDNRTEAKEENEVELPRSELASRRSTFVTFCAFESVEPSQSAQAVQPVPKSLICMFFSGFSCVNSFCSSDQRTPSFQSIGVNLRPFAVVLQFLKVQKQLTQLVDFHDSFRYFSCFVPQGPARKRLLHRPVFGGLYGHASALLVDPFDRPQLVPGGLSLRRQRTAEGAARPRPSRARQRR